MPEDVKFGFVKDANAMAALLAKKSTGTPLKSKAIADLWDDTAKSKAFFSARVTSADILEGLRQQVARVVSGGQTREQAVWWMKNFLESKGDSALQEMGFQSVEAAKEGDSLAELGSARRLQLIIDQNVSMARSARRWQEFQAEADIIPFVQYHTREDGSVRNSHALLNKLVFRKSDPTLKQIFPPQDFRCRCRVEELDEEDAAGLPIQSGLPDGWEPPASGYSFDPEKWSAQGQDAKDKWGDDLKQPFDNDVKAHMQSRVRALESNRDIMADLAINSTDARQKAESARAVEDLDDRIAQVKAEYLPQIKKQDEDKTAQAKQKAEADANAIKNERAKLIDSINTIRQNKEKAEDEARLQANKKKEGADLAVATKEEIAAAAKKAIESGSVTLPKNIEEIKSYLSKVAEAVKTNAPVEGTVSLGELLPKHKEQLGIPQDKKAEAMLSSGTSSYGVFHWQENHQKVAIDSDMAMNLFVLTLWSSESIAEQGKRKGRYSIFDKDSKSLCVLKKVGAGFVLEMVSLWNVKGSEYWPMTDLAQAPGSDVRVTLWF